METKELLIQIGAKLEEVTKQRLIIHQQISDLQLEARVLDEQCDILSRYWSTLRQDLSNERNEH